MPRKANIDVPSFNFQKQRVNILTFEEVFTQFLLRVKALYKPIFIKLLQMKLHCSGQLLLLWFMKTDTERIQARYNFRKEDITTNCGGVCVV